MHRARNQEVVSAKEFTKTKPKRASKYKNQPIQVDGIKFHSKAEAAYYLILKVQEKAGLIRDLCADKTKLHFPLVIDGLDGKRHKITSYTPDFKWTDSSTGRVVYADLKGGYFTGRSSHGAMQAYTIRKKLLYALYGIEVVEVEAPKSQKRKSR